MRVSHWPALAVIAVAALACRGAEAEAGPMEGELCAGPEAYCAGDDAFLGCVQGYWTSSDCADVCPSGTVGCTEDEPGGATCECKPVPEPEVTCLDADTLRECLGDVCVDIECAERCESLAGEWMFEGCRNGTCTCTAAGTPCPDDAAPRCAGQLQIFTCVDGLWSAEDCGPECDEPGTGFCRTSADGDPACYCEDTGAAT